MVVRVRSVAIPGCYYGSRSIGSRDPEDTEDPEDPGQETETQDTPETQDMHLGFVVIQRLTVSPNGRCTTCTVTDAKGGLLERVDLDPISNQ